MSDFAKSLLRDLVQKLMGIVFAWIGVHILAVPPSVKDAVTNWAVLTVTALLLLVWTTITRWLETREGKTKLDGYLRAAGRIAMMGVKGVPVYVSPEPTPTVEVVPPAPVASTADQTMVMPIVRTPTVLPSGDPIHPPM